MTRRMVFKVGTSTLTHENGKLNLRRIEELVRVLSELANGGDEICLVTSGAIGVGITYLLCMLANVILYMLTDLGNLRAVLPVQYALLFVGISVLLTLIAGIIPSRSASKKDPVVALRTE